MKVTVDFAEDTLATLRELEDEDGIDPSKRIHQWMRKLVFDPQPPAMASWCAEVSALKQRGSFPWRGREITFEQLLDRVKQFQPAAETNGGLEIILGQRVADILPRVIALNDLRAEPQERRDRPWSTLETFIWAHVTSECAKEDSRRAAKDAEDEEKALYPNRPKAAKPTA